MVLKSLKDRLRQRFNIAVAEIGDQDRWQSSIFGLATIGNDKRYLNGLLSQVENWIERQDQVEVVSSQMEFL